MGATLQNSVPMKEILKPTGYDIPASVANKTWGQATSGGGAVVEDNKNVSITANGTVEITPSSGNDAMAKVTATVNVPSKEEQTKSVTITENGTTTVSPDSGKVLSLVVPPCLQAPEAGRCQCRGLCWGGVGHAEFVGYAQCACVAF